MTTENGIQIASIEKELARLWGAQKDSKRVRACLFNLIVYAKDKQRIEYLNSLLYSIVEKFPCRILFFQENPEAEKDYLKVTVSNEVLGKGNIGIASDQIRVEISTQQLHRIPFIVLPNLVPDLPVYLLWGDDPTSENTILSSLERLISRIIFDPSSIVDLPSFSQKILTNMKAKPHLDFIDITWLLTTGWRNALVQVFDCPTALERLKTTKGIEIRYNSTAKPMENIAQCHAGREIQALYLAGWLAGQMEWRFVRQEIKEGSRHLTYHNGVNEFALILSPQVQEDLLPGAILGVEVSSSDDHFFFISPMPGLAKAVVHISSLETCEIPFTVPLPGFKHGFPYVQELFYSAASQHYLTMLQTLAQLKCGAK